MNHTQLSFKIIAAQLDKKIQYEYLLVTAGRKGLFLLFEQDMPGLHLIDATPEQILKFVKNR